MRALFLLAAIVLSSLVLLAEEKLTPPNVKEGLWESTVSHSSSGMPGIPADALAKMTPDQRAQVEAMMKQRGMSSNGNSTTVKGCVTKEKIAKGMAFSENRENCTRNVVSSTPSHFEIKLHCDVDAKNGNKTTTDGTVTVDVLGSDSVKGATHMVTNSNGRNMTMDSTFTSRYLGSDCGDIK
jgi:uncharacterized protein DUF3617